MLKIPFIKMHGLGNDFIIFDNIKNSIIHDSKFINKISNRRIGIGCDQVLIIENTNNSKNFKVKIYNSDGSETGACGNGTRCVADYLMKKNDLNSLIIKSISNDLFCSKTDNLVTVNMGVPKFSWNEIPLSKEQDTHHVKLDEFEAFCLSIGNPHAVIFINNSEELENLNINSIGPRLEKHSIFPKFANIEFVSVLEDKSLRMRVWERGVGITSACGSGACATLVAASSLNKSTRENKVVLDGGDLFIKWLDNRSVTLSGDTERVFEGFIGE
jgi:diaminopimelate epimerase